MATQQRDVPSDVVATIRSTCVALPEVVEERAWVGTRWRIRKKTFAHVLTIEGGWPPAYALAAGTDGPACVLTFRSWLVEFDRERFSRQPFFLPGWWPDIVGMTLDPRTDWDEVALLLAGSYRVMAPQKLAKLVEAPAHDP